MIGRNKYGTDILLKCNAYVVNARCFPFSGFVCISNSRVSSRSQSSLTDLFYDFFANPKRTTKIGNMQNLEEDPVLAHTERYFTLWLAYYNSLQTMHRNIESPLTYFSEVSQDLGKDGQKILKRKVHQYHCSNDGCYSRCYYLISVSANRKCRCGFIKN